MPEDRNSDKYTDNRSMQFPSRPFHLISWAVVALFALLTLSPARAQQPAAEAAPEQATNAAPSTSQTWIQKLANVMTGQQTHEYARNHPNVLQAFREPIAQSRQCSVRIICDNQQVALGTVVDTDGYVVTKASELKGEVRCELTDGAFYDARLVGTDRGSDLALLKISATDLSAIQWSPDPPPAVGGWVVTPGLSEFPAAIGIVSVAAHRVRGGILGIQMIDDKAGPRITGVVPGSGAALAGLANDDIITHVNGEPIPTSDDMITTTSNMLPGEILRLRILRDDEVRHIEATLGSVADTLTSRRAQFQDQLGSSLSKRRVLFPSALEHDSVLAPHQCGGALVNLDGQAIGVNIARASRISSYAIPASVARPIIESLMTRAADAVTTPVAAQIPATSLDDGATHQQAP